MLEAGAELLSVLSRNRLRTLLTAASVAWGMFMLAILLGAGRGLQNGVAWEFRDKGMPALWVRSGKTSLPYAGRPQGRDIYFRNGDYDALRRELPNLGHSSGRFYMWGMYRVRHAKNSASFDVRGAHPGHQHLDRTEIIRGRFLNDVDVREKRKVAVIAKKARLSLLGERDPIGELIQIRGQNYRVIGEFKDPEAENEAERIYVPISVAQLSYGQPDIIHSLMFTLKSPDLEGSREAAHRTRALLGERHEVSPEDRRAIAIQNNLEEYLRINQVFTWVNAFVWVVAIGTLVAGVVGVGNVMLIAVAERTREIGLRKAIGATSFSIVSMIVLEALTVTALSGYSGLVAGVLAVEAYARSDLELSMLRDPSVDIGVCLIASGVLVLSGILAGLFPALRAARVDPIVALREGM